MSKSSISGSLAPPPPGVVVVVVVLLFHDEEPSVNELLPDPGTCGRDEDRSDENGVRKMNGG
jgi:hypothetical protein